MGIESGNTVADLNANWPLGSDLKSQGDDHIRLIKTVITNDVLSLSAGGTISGAMTFEAGITAEGNITLDNDIALRGLTTGDLARSLLKINTSDELVLGGTNTAVNQYIANSSGRHDFYCGTGNLDATLNSNGFYLFGSTGVVTTGSLQVEATINTSTLAVESAGVTIGHGGSNAYFDNTLDVGNIQFRFGNTTEAFLESDGTFTVSSQSQSGMELGRGASNCYFNNVGNVGSFLFQFAGTNRAKIDNEGSLVIEKDGTSAAPAIVVANGSANKFGIYADGSGNPAIARGGSEAAQFDAAGTSLSGNTSVVTREKGDNRYHRQSTGEVILAAGKINASGSFEYKRGPVNMTVTKPREGQFVVSFGSTITDAVIQVSPANTSSVSARFCTITAYNDDGFTVDVKNPSNDYVSDTGVFVTVM